MIVYNASKVIIESPMERSLRKEREAASDERVSQHLAAVNREQSPWPNATAMLSWFFALEDHMSSIPAIDPSAEVIQGLRVDKDERAWKLQSTRQALRHLADAQGGHTGHVALWLHLRPRVLLKEFRRKGTTVRVWDDPVALDELAAAPTLRSIAMLSRRQAVQLYWSSLAVVEEFAFARKWIGERSKRKAKKAQVYRRNE